ncbi:MAG TPA: type III-B CRISPR module-associated protein Cmr3 [Terriglobia bacterium]|nr:type III-B CRISPR module-associated protein Cmr3 [Terriglobia bacterium]
MTAWIIEPIDPLIVRDGRPFGPTPGVRATSLNFPFPSTLAGGVRTRYGLCQNRDFDDVDAAKKADLIQTVMGIAVAGPILVQLEHETGEVARWFAPAPADALLFQAAGPQSNGVSVRRLLPHALPEGTHTNLPGGLLPTCLVPPDPSKPCRKAPRFWYWDKFEQWLILPTSNETLLAQLGSNGPVTETRTHVSVQPGTGTAAEGALFQTSGLEFSNRSTDGLSSVRRLALAFTTTTDGLTPGLFPFGGERRLTSWRKSVVHFPQCPSALIDSIASTQSCRIVLLTPAHFKAGFRPEWLTMDTTDGVKASLISVAAGRAQVISGWDFALRTPKPTRRLVPAGAVFFLKLDGDKDSIRQWVNRMWMQCVSDDTQDRLDGFGLAVPGAWSGETPKMKTEMMA